MVKQGSIFVPIYATTNRIYRHNPANGCRELKSEHPQFTLSYYEGSRRVKRKFADLESARREAEFAAVKLAKGEIEVLKLKGTDRADYVHASRVGSLTADWERFFEVRAGLALNASSARTSPERFPWKPSFGGRATGRGSLWVGRKRTGQLDRYLTDT